MNGKAKGSAFERDVCQQLSLWVSHGCSKDLFWRSAMSGGRSTVAYQKRGEALRRQAGDICAVAPEGHSLTDRFYVECKFYRSLDIASFFIIDKGSLAKFWRDTVNHAKRYNRWPLLIAKENRVPAIVLGYSGHIQKMVNYANVTAVANHAGCEVWLLKNLLNCTYYADVE